MPASALSSHTSRLPSNHLVKLGSKLLFIGEHSAQCYSGHRSFRTAHPTCRYAIVFARDLNGATQGLDLRSEGVGNLSYKVLLHYRASSQSLNEIGRASCRERV